MPKGGKTEAADEASQEGRSGPWKVIRDPEFGKRLERACDGNPLVPLPNFGRLAWFQKEMEKRGAQVSQESIRRYFAGEVRPRRDKLKLIAEILNVDEGWLAVGEAGAATPSERRARNAMAAGAVNVLAGVIQLAGGHPAFPEEGDRRAAEDGVDLRAIIKGASYEFHVILAESAGSGPKFSVPTNYARAIQVGVVQDGPSSFSFYELSDELVETKGQRRGHIIEVQATSDELEEHRIKTFANRL